jgi:hypothetical protein
MPHDDDMREVEPVLESASSIGILLHSPIHGFL